jgi:hypothetical protein
MSTCKKPAAKAAGQRTQADGKPSKPDPYQQVTDLIIEHVEKGVVPWRCPWNRETGRPRNFHSGKHYRGVNSSLLGCRLAASLWWMTYWQALERGGHVRKGERGAHDGGRSHQTQYRTAKNVCECCCDYLLNSMALDSIHFILNAKWNLEDQGVTERRQNFFVEPLGRV